MTYTPRIAIYRGMNANPGDAASFKEVPGAVMLGGGPGLEAAGKVMSVAEFDDLHDDMHSLLSYDVVDTPELYWPETAWLLANHPRVIVTVFEQIPHLRPSPAPELLARGWYVARTQEVATTLCVFHGVPAERICIIHPAVDADQFRPPVLPIVRGADKPVVGFVGKLVWRKGVWDLMRAAVILKNYGRPIDLCIVGTGDQEDQLRAFAAHYGLIARFLGQVPHEEMPLIYPSMDLLVLPSLPTDHWIEQFGLCLIEAMACGVPVIASDQTGPREIFVAMPQRLTPPGSYELLAWRILWALDQTSSRQYWRDYVTERFSHRLVAEKYQRLLGDVMA